MMWRICEVALEGAGQFGRTPTHLDGRLRSYLREVSPAPENLINRDLQAAAPNEKWLTDITEFQIPAGKVYLSPIVDCFDGLVISWSVGTKPDTELVNTMLDAAIETVTGTDKRPTVHSDRGAHYRWPGWISRISNAKLVRSMARKACSPDNAACEGFFGRLKTAIFYTRDWRSTTLEQIINKVDAYIRWCNEKRIKISLGARSPIRISRESRHCTVKQVQVFIRTSAGSSVLCGNQQFCRCVRWRVAMHRSHRWLTKSDTTPLGTPPSSASSETANDGSAHVLPSSRCLP